MEDKLIVVVVLISNLSRLNRDIVVLNFSQHLFSLFLPSQNSSFPGLLGRVSGSSLVEVDH